MHNNNDVLVDRHISNSANLWECIDTCTLNVLHCVMCHDAQEDADEAIESGGFLEMFSPWRYSRKLKAALLAEFVGMAIFQIYGGNSPDSGQAIAPSHEATEPLLWKLVEAEDKHADHI